MGFGIQTVNTSGELTLSSEGYLLSYLGKATHVSTTSYSGDASSSALGFSTYSFTSSTPIVCAIGLKASGQSGAFVERLSVSGTTWTIIVRDCSASTEGPSGGGSFWEQRTDSDVYVFGLPSPPAWGAAIYNSAGAFAGDLTRLPLTIRARVALASSATSLTIPSVTKPAVIGNPNSRHSLSTDTHSGPTPWINTHYVGSWQWNGSTTLSRVDVLKTYDHDDGGIPVTTVIDPTSALLIEANGLT